MRHLSTASVALLFATLSSTTTGTAQDDDSSSSLLRGGGGRQDRHRRRRELQEPAAEEAPETVLITEIMYNPNACSDATGEWIELYNNSPNPMDLSDWYIMDRGQNRQSIAEAMTILEPYDYYILGRTSNGCSNVLLLQANSTFSFALNNGGGDTLTLYNAESIPVDDHEYASNDANAGYTVQRSTTTTPEEGRPTITWESSPIAGGSPRSGYRAPVTATTTTTTTTSPPPPPTTYTTTRHYTSYTLELNCDLNQEAGYATRYSYELVGPDLGNHPRYSSFYVDPNLPLECQQQSRQPYSHENCGTTGRKENPYCFDRGHLVMANHLDSTDQDIYESNYMTNVLPQATGFNQVGGAWLETEQIIECARDIPQVSKQVIFGGALFFDSSNDYFIESHGIPTPDSFWKVVIRYFVDEESMTPQVVAWDMPNHATSQNDLLNSYVIPIQDLQDLINAIQHGNGNNNPKMTTNETMPELPLEFEEPMISWTKPSGCDLSR